MTDEQKPAGGPARPRKGEQTDLFGQQALDFGDGFWDPPEPKPGPAPFVQGSETSQAAAEAIEPTRGSKRAVLLTYMVSVHPTGATGDEMEAGTGMDGNTIRPRRRELEETGYIEKTQDRRLTRSGKAAFVYRATRKGIDLVTHWNTDRVDPRHRSV